MLRAAKCAAKCAPIRRFQFALSRPCRELKPSMTSKSGKIAALIEALGGQTLDAHYLGYFECFNRQLFFEAHEVLEELWLAHRDGPNYAFYKGLIQLAGAFVHLQKNRLRPAAALFRLADANLRKYPPVYEQLDLAEVLALIHAWLERLESTQFTVDAFGPHNAPKLTLCSSSKP
jgi:predicted metal-dependent hydrolase